MRTSIVRSVVAAGAAAAALVVTAGPASAHTASLEVTAVCPETEGGPWTVSWTASSWTSGEAGAHDDVQLQLDEDAYPANSGWESVAFFSFPVQATTPVETGTLELAADLDEVALRLFTDGLWRDGHVPAAGGWTAPVFVSQPTDCDGVGGTTTTTASTTTTTTESTTSTTESTTSTSDGGSTTSTSISGTSSTASTTPSTGDTTTTTEEIGVLPTGQTAPPASTGGDVDDDTEVEGVQVQRSPGRAGGALARTGTDSAPVALVGLFLAVAGSAVVVTAGRLRRRAA